MPSPSSAACLPFPRVLRGIYYKLFHGHRVYRARRSDGRWLNRIGVPVGLETEDDVIARLAVALAASDPLPPSEPVGRPRRYRPACQSARPARSAATPPPAVVLPIAR